MQKITLFGGSFDPPHLGHSIIIEEFLGQFPDHQVWLLPVGNHPFAKVVSAPDHRVAMCQLLLDSLPEKLKSKVSLVTVEIDNSHLSGQTFDTINYLLEHELYALDDPFKLSFLIGSDQLPHFHRWGHHQQLLEKVDFMVYPRYSFPPTPLLKGMKLLDHPQQTITNISSSQIRGKVANKLPTTTLLDPKVWRYIRKHKLYQLEK